jgi:hypothetical protein
VKRDRVAWGAVRGREERLCEIFHKVVASPFRSSQTRPPRLLSAAMLIDEFLIFRGFARAFSD